MVLVAVVDDPRLAASKNVSLQSAPQHQARRPVAKDRTQAYV
ncbi:hypothetical protein I552_4010 [Mycobacterium xenopi 3993]|nr:hypothetical protein I552_4010 [Mycobacterium xenopi 3993]